MPGERPLLSASVGLDEVDAERARRRADPALASRVDAVKRFQAARLERTYQDLLSAPDTAAAARFFLTRLYGAEDYSARDREFARVVPVIERMFPGELAGTIQLLIRLHALSEKLDTSMGEALSTAPTLDARAYAAAWQAVGGREPRDEQISLVVAVGTALVVYTRSRTIRTLLTLMRRPARAAGLTTIQDFLEEGFASFGSIKAPDRFIQTIAERERGLSAALFSLNLADPHRESVSAKLPNDLSGITVALG